MANKVTITMSNTDMNKNLAKMDKVQSAVESKAYSIYKSAFAMLSAHRKTGSHRIEIGHERTVKYGHIDWTVSLVGPAAVSVEFGHYSPDKNYYVDGLYIITLAMLKEKI